MNGPVRTVDRERSMKSSHLIYETKRRFILSIVVSSLSLRLLETVWSSCLTLK